MLEMEQQSIKVDAELQAEIELNQRNMSEVKDNLSDLLQVLSSDNEQLNTFDKQRLLLLDQHTKNNRQLDSAKNLVNNYNCNYYLK